MIQDIAPMAFHIEFEERLPDSGKGGLSRSYALAFSGRDILLNPERRLPLCRELEADYRYLFRIDDAEFFIAEGLKSVPEGFQYEDINIFRKRTEEKFMDFGGIEAFHLHNWYSTNRFCGRCGGRMKHSNRERALVCEDCANTVYPKISPAVIVAVSDGDRLLLTRYAGRTSGHALVAGFVEIGEAPEDAAKREVMEETGIKIKNLRYYRSQPWGFSQSLLMGFYAELDGSPEITVDTSELSTAFWVERKEIEADFDDFSLTNDMICRFKNGLEYDY